MKSDAREYLLDRFVTDAAALRTRAETLRSAARNVPGPDASTSLQMADACEKVAQLIRALPVTEPPGIMLQSLATLTLPLEDLAKSSAKTPAVRAVFIGAATRIRELLDAEAAAAKARDNPGSIQSDTN